jgi:hypothetical protein
MNTLWVAQKKLQSGKTFATSKKLSIQTNKDFKITSGFYFTALIQPHYL